MRDIAVAPRWVRLATCLVAILAVGGTQVAPSRGAVPSGRVDPSIAAVGATVEVETEVCPGGAADVRVVFFSLLPLEWSRQAPVSVAVAAARPWRLRVPRMRPGPYDVAISCDGDLQGFGDTGAGPQFTVEPRVVPGQAAPVFLWEPCGIGGEDAPEWGSPSVYLARSRAVRTPDDARLIEAEVIRRAATFEGFFVEIAVPRVPVGAYFVYTSCGERFVRNDSGMDHLPPLRVVRSPDTATLPKVGVDDDPERATGLLAVMFAAVLLGMWHIARRRRSARAAP